MVRWGSTLEMEVSIDTIWGSLGIRYHWQCYPTSSFLESNSSRSLSVHSNHNWVSRRLGTTGMPDCRRRIMSKCPGFWCSCLKAIIRKSWVVDIHRIGGGEGRTQKLYLYYNYNCFKMYAYSQKLLCCCRLIVEHYFLKFLECSLW